MFYDLFCELCKKNGVAPTRAAIEMGLSKATPTTWKNKGTTPQAAQLQKIAEYFNVTVDYLLGNDTKKEPAQTDEPDVLDGIEVAFLGDYKELTEENKAVLRDMVRIMRERQGGNNE